MRCSPSVLTFGLHCERHVVSGVVSLPELLQTLVHVYLVFLWLCLQSLGVPLHNKVNELMLMLMLLVINSTALR